MVRNVFTHTYNDIISIENLLGAWQEFLSGKKNKSDVVIFQNKLMENIFSLHFDLKNKTYRHSDYYAFNISDPKPRNIHKASVRDRVLHHAIYKILYPYFDKKFIYDSYSCRINKGTHKAINRFKTFANKVSKNHTKTTWILKCDVRKFFASIGQNILVEILAKEIKDENIIWLIKKVIKSFDSGKENTGLPLGNLTSQLFVNIYMNQFDQYVKHILKVKYYIRYADDFVVLSRDRKYLENLIFIFDEFLNNKLKLKMHPDKVFIKTLNSRVDFLGHVHFHRHRVLRTTTKRRMFRNLGQNNYRAESVNSYLGLLKHGQNFKLKQKIFEMMWRDTI